jgi:hypothetical protein
VWTTVRALNGQIDRFVGKSEARWADIAATVRQVVHHRREAPVSPG